MLRAYMLGLSLAVVGLLAVACDSSGDTTAPTPGSAASVRPPVDTPIGQQITRYYQLVGRDQPLWSKDYPDPAQMDTKTVMGAIANPQLAGCQGPEMEYLDHLEGAIDVTSQFYHDVVQLHTADAARPCGAATEFIQQPAKGEGAGKTDRRITLKAISPPDGALVKRDLRLVLVRNCRNLPLWLLTDADGPVTGCA